MKKILSPFLACAASVLLLGACSPKFDWREIHGNNAPYVANFPAKPASQSRTIDLSGTPATMTMTAAQIDGVTYAVGSAEMTDAARAQAALALMKTALVKNIDGTIRMEKTSVVAKSANGIASASTAIDIEATGYQLQNGSKQSMQLIARFVAQDKWVYQIIVVGKEGSIARDAVEAFFSGFRLNR
jgi:hypothetical protein